ncbi:MAG: ABC transporter permease, partial [Sphingobacterium sp.]
STQWAAGAFAVGNHLKNAIPEVEDYAKVVQLDDAVTYIKNSPLKIDQVFYATNSFFRMFTFPLVAGSSTTALDRSNTAALSETTAKKIFGTANAVGKSLLLNRNSNFIVTAVYKDPPANTQLRPNLLLSYSTFLSNEEKRENSPEENWEWDGCLTYILLNKNANPRVVEDKFNDLVQKIKGRDLKSRNVGLVYHLQSLKDIHLSSRYLVEPGEVMDGKVVYLLFGIALFIMVIAWINYINLATARAITRAKEIGVRKCIGSRKGQLIFQFLLETALMNFIALLFSLGIIFISIPGFNLLSGQHLSFLLFANPVFWICFGLLFIIGTCVSGLYPAIIIAGYNPMKVLNERAE